MEYNIVFENSPEAESIIRIAEANGAIIEESEDANFGGGETFTLIANGICAIGAIAQILSQFGFMKKERVILIRPGKPTLRNITLEEAEKIIQDDEHGN